jgi:hypothetical protein
MKHIITILFISLLFTSCSKVLDKKPEAVFSPSNFYKTSADAVAAVSAVYSPLLSGNLYNQVMWVFQDQSTDDAEWGNGRNTANQAKNDLDKYTFTPSTVYFYALWTTCYQAINRANTAITNIPNISMDATLKGRLIGEATFMRAFYYYTLVRLFGKVPLITKATTDLSNLNVSRSSVDSVYKQIIADFSAAESVLPLSYSGADKGRATKGAAKAYLASVYLTLKQWDKASAKAKEVIDMESQGVYGLWDNYSDAFLIANKNGKEAIFEIQALGGGFGQGSYMQGFMRAPYDRGGYGDDPPTKNIYDAYSAVDKRRDVNLKLFSSPPAPSSIAFPCYVGKYQDPSATGNGEGNNNYPVFRYAEVLLIYAEALNEQGANNSDAYAAINRIRNRAGLNDLTPGLSQDQFRDSVYLERRLELAFEGHRRYDLIRTGKLIEAMNAQNPGIIIKPYQVLFPIPQSEIDANPMLDQNPGY